MQVVFGQEEERALQVLLPLIGVIPEALPNAVIFYLKQGQLNVTCFMDSHITTVPLIYYADFWSVVY